MSILKTDSFTAVFLGVNRFRELTLMSNVQILLIIINQISLQAYIYTNWTSKPSNNYFDIKDFGL